MNLKIQTVATWAAIASLALAATACQQATNKAAETTTTTTSTATTAATPAAGDAATPASSTTTTTTASTANIPAECQAYLTAVQACVDHMSSSNPAVAAQFRTTMESTRASWASVTDQHALATACTTATNAFNSSAHAMGC